MQKYPIEVFWSEEDEGFIAVVPDLAGCSAWGKTEADALRVGQNGSQKLLALGHNLLYYR